MMKITLKDGSVKEYENQMAVIDIAKDISEGLARMACAGEIDGETVDEETGLKDFNNLTSDDRVSYVIEQMEQAMEGIGRMYSYWEGSTYTALYFYGTSFAEMKEKIEPFIASYPLCQKSRIEQIA